MKKKPDSARRKRPSGAASTDPAIKMLRSQRGMMADIANSLGISTQATSLWQRVPPERVLTIEKLTGIPRHVLRPDLYPPPARLPRLKAARTARASASI